MDEEKKFTICYETKEGDTCNVWLWANDEDDAHSQVQQEYWDIESIISIMEM